MKNNQSAIGLDLAKSAELAKGLNELLADYQIFYINTRGYHWNVKGEKFFELHLKFEELYTDLQIKIDEVAERILTLGHTPMHSFSDFLANSSVKEHSASEGRKCIEGILNAFVTIINKQRVLLNLAAEAGDEGSNALMSDYIRLQEKQVWMYNAYMS